MSHKLFVSLPIKNLDRSVAFFKALGFTFNPKLTGENAACMLIGEHAYAMLLVMRCSANQLPSLSARLSANSATRAGRPVCRLFRG